MMEIEGLYYLPVPLLFLLFCFYFYLRSMHMHTMQYYGRVEKVLVEDCYFGEKTSLFSGGLYLMALKGILRFRKG